MTESLKGRFPESWHCHDCGVDTARGFLNRTKLEAAIAAPGKRAIRQTLGDRAEVYTLHDSVWAATGMAPWGGCLCIGCVEVRLGRRLRPNDFTPGHPFNEWQATRRLRRRRDAR